MRALLFSLAMIALTGTATADERRPLHALAALIPQDINSAISMIDIAAAREQTLALVKTDFRGAKLVHFGHLALLEGVSLSHMLLYEETFQDDMGFPFAAIDAMAGFGTPPRQQAILWSGEPFDNATLSSALDARGFEVTEKDYVRFRGEDLQITAEYFGDDPFSAIGQSARFWTQGNVLHHAKTFADIHIQMDGSPKLTDEPDIDALLSVLYDIDIPGALIQVHLLPTEMNFSGAGRLAIANWQQGATLTGAFALVFADRAEADTAALSIEAALEEPLLDSTRTLREALGSTQQIEVVETGERAILVAAFSQSADLEKGISFASFIRNPHSQLIQMIIGSDFPTLLGVD